MRGRRRGEQRQQLLVPAGELPLPLLPDQVEVAHVCAHQAPHREQVPVKPQGAYEAGEVGGPERAFEVAEILEQLRAVGHTAMARCCFL